MIDKKMEMNLKIENQKRAELKILVESTTSISEETYTKLKDIFSVSKIHESVKNYLETYFDKDTIEDPFGIYGTKTVLEYIFTYKELFAVDYDDGIFPAIYIGGIRGIYFYILIETGQVLSIHHDSLSELGWDYFEEGQSLEDSLNNMLDDYSLFNIDQLLNLQKALKDYDYDDLEDEFEIEEMRDIVSKNFNWTKEELDKKTSNLAMEFLYDLLEEE